MERVTIVGCCGSGKTHLALQLAERMNAPVMHLDTVYYDAERNILSDDEFAAAQRDLVSRPRWVVEGNYASTLPLRLAASDTIVVLNLPTLTCVGGVLQRRLRSGSDRPCGGGGDDALAVGDEGLGARSLIGVNGPASWGNSSYMLKYRRSVLPRIRQMISLHGLQAEVVELRSRRAADRFADGVLPGHPLPGDRSVTD